MSHGRQHTLPARLYSRPLGGDVAASRPRKCCKPWIYRLRWIVCYYLTIGLALFFNDQSRRSLSHPYVVTCGIPGGGIRGASADQASMNENLPSDMEGMDEDKVDFEENELIQREDDGAKENSEKEDISEKEDYGGNGGIEEDRINETCNDNAVLSQEQAGLSQERELFKAIKEAHDLAKAIKSDDAEVPKHLWDVAVCRGPPSLEQAKALSTLRLS
jgi:hypothetical protein